MLQALGSEGRQVADTIPKLLLPTSKNLSDASEGTSAVILPAGAASGKEAPRPVRCGPGLAQKLSQLVHSTLCCAWGGLGCVGMLVGWLAGWLGRWVRMPA